MKLFVGLIRKPVTASKTLLLGLRITSVPRIPIVCGATICSVNIVDPDAAKGIFTVVIRLLVVLITSIAAVVGLRLVLVTYIVVVYPLVPSKSGSARESVRHPGFIGFP